MQGSNESPTSEPRETLRVDASSNAAEAPHPPGDIAAPAQRSALHSLFFGRFGMRAGYGILFMLVLWGILATAGGFVALASQGRLHDLVRAQQYARAHPGAPKPAVHFDFTPGFVDVQDGITFLPLLGACWLFSRGERRPLRAYGIARYRFADVLPGAFWGVVLMSVLVATLRALHLLVFDGRALHGGAVLVYGVDWLAAFLLVGLAEEYAFRGYVQYSLMRGVWGLAERISPGFTRAVAFWIAACALSLLFALAHAGNSGENAFGLVLVFLAGVTFAYALWRTGSLWWGVGFHMAWDWAQSFLFGVADSGNVSVGRLFVTHAQGRPLLSGGTDGPEGSLFAGGALLLTILVIRFTTRPGTQPALEPNPLPLAAPFTPMLHKAFP